ncbi:MAG: ABC transporter permease [Clostridia bacterium]
MLNMLRADSYRMIHGKSYRVCLFLTMLWVILNSYAQTATIEIREIITGSQVAVKYWDTFFNYYPVIIPLVIFCSYYISNDFKQGTIKNYIARGISRWNYYLSKLLVGWFASSSFLLVAFITGTLSSKILLGNVTYDVSIWNVSAYLLCQLLFHCAASSMGITIAFLARNSTISTIINLLWVMFGYLCIHSIENILGLGYQFSIFWVASNINKTRIEQAPQWLFIAVLLFVSYAIIGSFISMLSLHKKDIA